MDDSLNLALDAFILIKQTIKQVKKELESVDMREVGEIIEYLLNLQSMAIQVSFGKKINLDFYKNRMDRLKRFHNTGRHDLP